MTRHSLSILLVLGTLANPGAGLAQSTATEFYSRADRFLQRYVRGGNVRYAALAENSRSLDSVLATISRVRLDRPAPPGRKALLINAYNVFAIEGIVRAYPVESPLAVEGFFEERTFCMGGRSLTLDELEQVLFDRFPDPRMHFALVCAAAGCPELPDSTYRPATLSEQLDRSTRLALSTDEFVEVDRSSRTLRLSEMFSWYRSHFVRHSGSLIAFVNTFRESRVPSDYEIVFSDYDWSLNEAR